MKKILLIPFFMLTTFVLNAQQNDSIWAEIINDTSLYTSRLNTIFIYGINDSLDYTINSPGFTVITTNLSFKFMVKTNFYNSEIATFTIRKRGEAKIYGTFSLPLKKFQDTTSVITTNPNSRKTSGFSKEPMYTGNLIEAIQNNFVIPDSFKVKKKGRILINFSISMSGNIEEINVVKSDFPELNDAAIEAIKKLGKFRPAIQNGNPVKFNMVVPISIN